MFVESLVGDGEYIVRAVRPHWVSILRPFLMGAMMLGLGLFLLLFPQTLLKILAGLPAIPTNPLSVVAPAQSQNALSWLGIGLVGVGLLVCAWTWLVRHNTEYAITTIRVVAVSATVGVDPVANVRRNYPEYHSSGYPGYRSPQGDQADSLDYGSTNNLGNASRLYGGRIIRVYGFPGRHSVIVPLQMVQDLVVRQSLVARILGWGTLDIVAGNEFKDDVLPYLPDPYAFYNIWNMLTNNLTNNQGSLPVRLPRGIQRGGLFGASEVRGGQAQTDGWRWRGSGRGR
jgi:hypothetical protein